MWKLHLCQLSSGRQYTDANTVYQITSGREHANANIQIHFTKYHLLAGNMQGQFQQNVFPLGSKPPQEEEEENEEEKDEQGGNDEESDDNNGSCIEEGEEKGMFPVYVLVFGFPIIVNSALGPYGGNGGSAWCDEERGAVTGVEVRAGIFVFLHFCISVFLYLFVFSYCLVWR